MFQIEKEIRSQFEVEWSISNPPQITPIERRGDHLVKRDDLWDEGGIARGGKARTAGLVCRRILSLGGTGMCLALGRNSSVPGMVSRLCHHYALSLNIHIPKAGYCLSPVFEEAVNNGAEVFQHRCGYMAVLRSKIRDQIRRDRRLYEVGVGLLLNGSGSEKATSYQTRNIPECVERIVVPVGSGGMIGGIADGMEGRRVKIIGVCVARKPIIRQCRNISMVESKFPFHKNVDAKLDGIPLDPTYEAKCIDFLIPGDLLWIVGHRDTE